MLKGKKTYAVAGLLVLQAILSYFGADVAEAQASLLGFLGSPEATRILEGLGLAALRKGVSG